MNNMIDLSRFSNADKHRPQLHFSPARNWMNDPNGMVYYEGIYHLFYQYNPADKVWDDMHWGHAVSADLIHWEEKPVALHSERHEDGLGHIFSGSAVVDWTNSSGLGDGIRPPLIAIFTHSSDTGVQVQSIAYSNDAGETWAMYDNNPVIDNPGNPDFRDPKVFWDARFDQWVMVLAANTVIQFYSSKDLINWVFLNDFGAEFSINDGVWECPDLFPLEVEGSQEQKWVLLVSLNPGGPNGGSGTRYFIGNFDGDRFQVEHSDTLWLDCGPDNYAGVTWSDMPSDLDRRILMGWMSNWSYASEVPTDPWRGAMTLPRELRLIQTKSGLRLASPLVKEFELLRKNPPRCIEQITLNEPRMLTRQQGISELLELEIVFDSPTVAGGGFRLRLFNDSDEQVLIDINLGSNEVRLNRQYAASGVSDENHFSTELRAPLLLNDQGKCSIRLIKDTSSIELLTGEGLGIFSALYFVENPLNQIEIATLDSVIVSLNKIVIYELTSIWRQKITTDTEAT